MDVEVVERSDAIMGGQKGVEENGSASLGWPSDLTALASTVSTFFSCAMAEDVSMTDADAGSTTDFWPGCSLLAISGFANGIRVSPTLFSVSSIGPSDVAAVVTCASFGLPPAKYLA